MDANHPNEPHCVACNRTGQQVPLIALEFQNQKFWICPQHLPMLIHDPKTLTGKLMLRIPPETQTGRTFRLAGQGLPHFRKEGRGDLFARMRVVLPTELSADAKKAAEEFLDLAEGHER